MIVVGGTYQETCRDTAFSGLIGSGVRAAACLSGVLPDVHLHSAVEEGSRQVAQVTAAGFGLARPSWVERTLRVEFAYETPLSPPTLYGRDARLLEPLVVEHDAVLAFGLVEGEMSISADALVVDPQHDIGVELLRSYQRQRLAVVASGAEITALAGIDSVEDAARALLNTTDAAVVVAKLGAIGAVVVTPEGAEGVGPRPTPRTWPIGSGDAFAAGFAWAWAVGGADPVEAARVGSAAAAAWCSTRTLPLNTEALEPGPSVPLRPRPRVYLAGPFFDVAQRWLVDLSARALNQLGAKVFSPFHHVGPGGPEVASADLDGLAGCDCVLALLDGLDPGTVFEVGWATKAGLPVVAFCQRCSEADLTMVVGSGTALYDDLSSAVYAAIWAGDRA